MKYKNDSFSFLNVLFQIDSIFFEKMTIISQSNQCHIVYLSKFPQINKRTVSELKPYPYFNVFIFHTFNISIDIQLTEYITMSSRLCKYVNFHIMRPFFFSREEGNFFFFLNLCIDKESSLYDKFIQLNIIQTKNYHPYLNYKYKMIS